MRPSRRSVSDDRAASRSMSSPVLQGADALHALRLERLQDPLHACDQAPVFEQNAVDHGRIPGRRPALLQRHPGRAFELNLVVPLAVVHGRQHGLAAFALVVGHAQVFVGEELRAQHPDLLRVIARGLHVQLVDELHHRHMLAHLSRGALGHGGGVLGVPPHKGPEVAVVVAVHDGRLVRPRAELGPLGQRAVVVCQRHADIPRHGVVVRLGQDARLRVGPQRAPQRNPGVVVCMAGVDQRARQSVQPIPRGRLGRGRHGVQPRPQRPQTGKARQGQGFDARILHHADQGHLPRRQPLGRAGLAGEHQMRGGVRSGRAVQLRRGHRAGGPLDRVVGIGQVDDAVLDEGTSAFALLEIGRRGPQIKIAPPQRPQVHLDAPLHVHQQGAFALLLQHRQGFAGLQIEVRGQLLRLGAVRLHAPMRPAAQAPQAELPQ